MAFRMGSQLHERLIASAEANERSLSEEIERRLEDSFGEQERLIDRFGGPENLNLLTTIASAWKLIEVMSRQKWTQSQDVLNAMRVAASDVMAMVKPIDDRDPANYVPGGALAALGEPYRHYQTIGKLGAASAAYAVALAKRIDVSDEISEAIVKSAMDFGRRNEAVESKQ
ncbi:TraY domain-containing protein [Methylobacterium sp. J-030]|uniref:TraY domain-containing protein n=1 Tax=Methylobacterium sp. J-030 TaxID=2836627 RepID=UPI001FB9A1DA|nr:TraY domain-containing protein [Methylobacterium sp. J-030]MCJ2067359.1 TraY domain-containing protein [Methylobacterium sp. J-030]